MKHKLTIHFLSNKLKRSANKNDISPLFVLSFWLLLGCNRFFCSFLLSFFAVAIHYFSKYTSIRFRFNKFYCVSDLDLLWATVWVSSGFINEPTVNCIYKSLHSVLSRLWKLNLFEVLYLNIIRKKKLSKSNEK